MEDRETENSRNKEQRDDKGREKIKMQDERKRRDGEDEEERKEIDRRDVGQKSLTWANENKDNASVWGLLSLHFFENIEEISVLVHRGRLFGHGLFYIM